MRKVNTQSRLLFLVILTLLFGVNALSQTGTSTVTGTVTDAQGNLVPGASVTLISGQNNRRTTVTGDNGTYTFASIQPGSYRIEVEAKNFKKSSLSEFQAPVDKTSEINVKLDVGAVTETVNVDTSGIESIVNTQDASLGNNFVSQQISQLPLQGRNVANLLSLQAGVTPDGSVTGSRRDQANITLDGIDVNDQQTGLNINQDSAFTPVLRVNPDSVEEFRVTTSNPDAGKGRSSGAQISLITKSGTNQFHGALYEYHRNTLTSANNYFNNLAGVERPKLLRNLFGGRLSGPILKDRLFFFYNYEGMRESKGVTVVQTVPLPSLGAGNLRFVDTDGVTRTLNIPQINALTSNGNAVVDVNPVSLAVLAGAASHYAANDSTVGDGLNVGGYRFNAPQPVKENGQTARLDWTITNDQKHQLSFRGNYQQDFIGGVQQFPDTPAPDTWSHPLGLAATYTWLISSNKTNRFSYGLTRLAFSNSEDSDQNAITFRGVFSPTSFTRPFARVNPTQNFTDDFTWIKGNHTLQFGTNVRLIRNKRTNSINSFDNAVANFSYYSGSGNVVLTPLNQYLAANFGEDDAIADNWTSNAGYALTALFGRLSQYTAIYNFDKSGNVLAQGTPIVREFATEEYDWYGQDIWKFKPNLTLTLGLRYSLGTPVYETQGYEVAPNVPLEQYLQEREAASAQGQNFTDPITMNLAGPANNAPGLYKMDKNNFQPRVAMAWSPNFEKGWLAKFFGKKEESVIRGGFSITNDHFGEQLATSFDANTKLGFSSQRDISANTFNVTTRPAPLYTGSNMAIKGLSNITVPGALTFPQLQPLDGARRIESSLDTDLQTPINYSWNVSYGRQLPGKMYIDVSYVGRIAKHLLATRDIMQPNNLTDPKSGQTWYQAATILEMQRRAGVPINQIQSLPFFENLFAAGSLDTNPNVGQFSGLTNTQTAYAFFDPNIGYDVGNDWTYLQDQLDGSAGLPGGIPKAVFYQQQYGALSAFGTIGRSNYHGMTVSIRQRLKGLTWDLNYTWSKSMDDASGLQTSTGFGTAFILNSLRQEDNYSVSDFDLRHIINFNSVWDIPMGHGRMFLKNSNKIVNGFLGGWQLTSIFRYNSGAPVTTRDVFFDNSGWVTNWNAQSYGVQIAPIPTGNNKTSGDGGVPNLFNDPQTAYNSFRSPFPGETGDRNQLRFPGYFSLDAGLAKSFTMPWNEGHKVTIRWDVFNVTNTAIMGGADTNNFKIVDTALGYQPNKGTVSSSFGNFSAQQGSPRVMQFALRYDF